MKPTSENAEKVPMCKTREMMVRAKALGALNLAQGAPGFDTPQHIKDAAISAISKGYNQYCNFKGLPELRQSVSKRLAHWGIQADADKNIIITAGVMEALCSTLLTLLNKDDEVITFGPRYVSYEAHPVIAGAKVIISNLNKDDFSINWPDFESKINERTKVIILGTPHNPTGKVFTREELEKLAEIAVKHDLFVISDEIYEDFIFEGEHISIATLPGMADRTITTSGLSKSFAVTGWRVGYLAASEELCKKIGKVHTHLVVCAPHMCQVAGITALEGDQKPVGEMRLQYLKNRDMVMKTLSKIGLKCTKPAGAFYAMVDVRPLGMNGTELAQKLLGEANVAVVPGDEFGEDWKDFIRISFSRKGDEVRQALEQVETYLKGE